MWIRLFTTEQDAITALPDGKPRLLRVGALHIALVRVGYDYFAVQDFCTHNKESLSKGIINYKGEIICPWHGYCFELKTGRELHQRSADLKTYTVKTTQEGVFIEVPEG